MNYQNRVAIAVSSQILNTLTYYIWVCYYCCSYSLMSSIVLMLVHGDPNNVTNENLNKNLNFYWFPSIFDTRRLHTPLCFRFARNQTWVTGVKQLARNIHLDSLQAPMHSINKRDVLLSLNWHHFSKYGCLQFDWCLKIILVCIILKLPFR